MNGISSFFMGLLQTVFLTLDLLVYSIINMFYEVFIAIVNIRLFNPEDITFKDKNGVEQVVEGSTFMADIAQNIYVLIGVVAIFKITFTLITILANPDKLSDKEKGGGAIIKKFITMIILIIVTPFVFNMAYDVQRIVLDENLIGKIITVETTGEESNLNAVTGNSSPGTRVANSMFGAFISEGDKVNPGDSDCADAISKANDIENTGISGMFKYINKTAPANSRYEGDQFCINYMWGISTLSGAFAAWIFFMYCFEVGIRVAKLAFLQLISPIPIVSIMAGDKDTAFKSWLKTSITTFIDVFLRVAIIFFILQVIPAVTEELFHPETGMFQYQSTSDNPVVNGLAKVAVILGLLAFAKDAPKLIQDMFGIQGDSGSFGVGIDRFKKHVAPIHTARAVGAAGAAAAATGINNSIKTFKDTDGKAAKKLMKSFGSSVAGSTSALAKGLPMAFQKDVKAKDVYSGAYTHATGKKQERDNLRKAGYGFKDMMLDKARTVLDMDTKIKTLSDDHKAAIDAKNASATESRRTTYEQAMQNGVLDSVTSTLSQLTVDFDKNGNPKYKAYNEKTKRFEEISDLKQYTKQLVDVEYKKSGQPKIEAEVKTNAKEKIQKDITEKVKKSVEHNIVTNEKSNIESNVKQTYENKVKSDVEQQYRINNNVYGSLTSAQQSDVSNMVNIKMNSPEVQTNIQKDITTQINSKVDAKMQTQQIVNTIDRNVNVKMNNTSTIASINNEINSKVNAVTNEMTNNALKFRGQLNTSVRASNDATSMGKIQVPIDKKKSVVQANQVDKK